MLVSCPECAREISDRAKTCPGCGFPIADEIAAREAAKVGDRGERKHIGEVDCPTCEARGFRTFDGVDETGRTVKAFDWCERCDHTGRVALVQSTRGYYAVVLAMVEAFVAGEEDEGEHAKFLGANAPGPHRYPKP
jgi:zinc ribbon protein